MGVKQADPLAVPRNVRRVALLVAVDAPEHARATVSEGVSELPASDRLQRPSD